MHPLVRFQFLHSESTLCRSSAISFATFCKISEAVDAKGIGRRRVL
jgi:hypothetical protein